MCSGTPKTSNLVFPGRKTDPGRTGQPNRPDRPAGRRRRRRRRGNAAAHARMRPNRAPAPEPGGACGWAGCARGRAGCAGVLRGFALGAPAAGLPPAGRPAGFPRARALLRCQRSDPREKSADRREEEKRRKKLHLDHRRSLAGPPHEALTLARPPPDHRRSLAGSLAGSPPEPRRITAGASPDHRRSLAGSPPEPRRTTAGASSDHHLRASPLPEALTFAKEALTFVGPPPKALTFVRPPSDVVAPPNSHLRPCAQLEHHLRPGLLLGHYLMPRVPPEYRPTKTIFQIPVFCQLRSYRPLSPTMVLPTSINRLRVISVFAPGSSGRSWIVRDDRYSSVDLISVRFRSDFCTDLSAVLVLGRARKSRIRFQSLIRLDDYFEEMNSDRCFVPLHLMFLILVSYSPSRSGAGGIRLVSGRVVTLRSFRPRSPADYGPPDLRYLLWPLRPPSPDNGHSLMPTRILPTSVAYYGSSDLHHQTTVFPTSILSTMVMLTKLYICDIKPMPTLYMMYICDIKPMPSP
ncbi:hypothetical protein KFK09_016448 [Dendrobium nobile]|uniref:Uncharacterized protein n=1 Tax=Dendrobium nobile TaxID=94219 RepID=A0A8T3AY99_DENNO|nr:hypothetical protein KFK09_016448 [Dendrobium nobile]